MINLLIFLSVDFSHQRKGFAREARAIVALLKGTEVVFSYKESLRSRAVRRGRLSRFGFVCNCEMCALPDSRSNALDTKIKKSNEAAAYLERFCGRIPTDPEQDIIRAVELLDIYMSVIIEERLFTEYTQFNIPLRVLAVFGKPALFEQLAQAVLRLFRRHLAPGHELADEETLRSFADMKLLDIIGISPDHPLHAHLETTASTIISKIESLP
jgi:hypothetical protein